jgi:hypothetical protein
MCCPGPVAWIKHRFQLLVIHQSCQRPLCVASRIAAKEAGCAQNSLFISPSHECGTGAAPFIRKMLS